MNIPTYFNTSLLVLNVMFMHISLVINHFHGIVRDFELE
jgi:hypothetical protein